MTGHDRDAFRVAYDKVMAKRPGDRQARTVPTPFGRTRVTVCGPGGAPPPLLPLPGGGASPLFLPFPGGGVPPLFLPFPGGGASPLFLPLPGGGGRRPGRSRRHRRRSGRTFLRRLDRAAPRPAFTGPGALLWPARVRRLFLLDPTGCFAGSKAAYPLHALPMLLRPTPRRVRAFLAGENGGAPVDPDRPTFRRPPRASRPADR